MNELQARLARLERQLNVQAARIDDLQRVLETNGLLPSSKGDALFDPDDDEFSATERRRPGVPRSSRPHLGNASGV